MIIPSGIDSPPPTIDIHMAGWINRGPGVGIISHHPDGQLIGDPEIDPQGHSASGEVVALGVSIGIDTNKVTETGHPDAPTIFGGVLENPPHPPHKQPAPLPTRTQPHGPPLDLHVGTEAVGA